MDLEAGLRFLDSVSDVCGDVHVPEAMQSSAEDAKAELWLMMQRQVSPDGTPYAPLAPSTVKRKGHARALYETGGLFESVVGNGQGHVEEIQDNQWKLGTEHEKKGEPIALYMQEGTKNKDGSLRVPARPFLGVTEGMATSAAEAVADDVMNQIAGM